MKVTKHVEHLLRQGHKPKELVELGFPKSVVTKVRRQLMGGKATPQAKVPRVPQAETHIERLPESPENMVGVWQKLQSMADDLQKVDSLAKALPEVTILIGPPTKLALIGAKSAHIRKMVSVRCRHGKAKMRYLKV